MLAPGLLQGLTRGGGQAAIQQPTPAQPERRFEGLAENIMSQMARAGKPRRTVTTSTLAQPEEPLDWSNLMMLLMMILQGQQPGGNIGAENIAPPESGGFLEPRGGPVTPGGQPMNLDAIMKMLQGLFAGMRPRGF